MRSVAFFLAAVLSLVFQDAALGAESAAFLHRAGRYGEAIAEGIKEGDGEGLTVAAEAAFAVATLRDSPCIECLDRAEAYARQAIGVDPNRARAYVSLVATLAYEARRIGVFAAQRAHLPAEAKNALDNALSLSPEDPWTLAAIGAWNIEVARAAGTIVARVVYGADFETGHAFFSRAVAADPGNPLITYHFALAITSYAFEAKRTEVMALLEASARGKPEDAYSEAIRKRSEHLLDLLAHGKRAEYAALARRYLGFPT